MSDNCLLELIKQRVCKIIVRALLKEQLRELVITVWLD